jgi:tetratricopeptide (TPR) repeat protein
VRISEAWSERDKPVSNLADQLLLSLLRGHQFLAAFGRASGAAKVGLCPPMGWDDAVALYGAAYGLSIVVGNLDYAAAVIDRALLLNPNLMQAWLASGWIRVRRGEPELGLEQLAHARRLSPIDPVSYVNFGGTAAGHFFAGCYDDAALWAEKAQAAQLRRPEDYAKLEEGLRKAGLSE